MNVAAIADEAPTRQWSVEGFGRFWKNPQNPEIILPVIWPEIAGYWPRAEKPLTGKEAYLKGIIDFLAAVPNFSAKVADYAFNGDCVFIRWEATGKPVVGPKRLTGVDRMILKDGVVLENRIHSDHPIFAHLAETQTLG